MKSWSSKKEFQELVIELLNPLKDYYTENRAGICLGVTSTNYDEKAILMEAFSRPFWGLVPFFAGGGRNQWFEEVCRKGLISGTDPENKEFWGNPGEYDQRFVEMAAIACGMLLAPDVLWDPFSEEEKERIAAYLYTINEHEIPECNWMMFRVLVNIALKKQGFLYNEKKLVEALDMTESFYLGEGWYRDGDSGQKDYYIPFALHYYSLVYAKVMEKEDPERCKRFKERAKSFAKQFVYWFDEDGEALPFGRSLCYRFAQVSFFSACLLANLEPFSIGVMKGLIVRHLQYWLSQPIFDRNNILTIGYAYPNLVMAEKYNGPGSAYWGMKVFAFLALPDEHPFWSVQAEEFPKLPEACTMKYADMLVKRYPHHVTAYTPGVYSPNGHGQIVSKYGKFAYDTKFGFSVAKSCYEIYENCPDSMLAFWIDGYVYVRRICEEREIRENEVYSKWSPYTGIVVETTITPTKSGHIRKHNITSNRNCQAYDCGFSVAANLSDQFQTGAKEGMSFVENKQCCCIVKGDGNGIIITADPNTNILYSKTLLPAIQYEIMQGTQEITTEIVTEVKERER